jgi:hypothetical protein
MVFHSFAIMEEKSDKDQIKQEKWEARRVITGNEGKESREGGQEGGQA